MDCLPDKFFQLAGNGFYEQIVHLVPFFRLFSRFIIFHRLSETVLFAVNISDIREIEPDFFEQIICIFKLFPFLQNPTIMSAEIVQPEYVCVFFDNFQILSARTGGSFFFRTSSSPD